MANMRISLVLFVLVCIVNPRAFCLQCYACKSKVSFEDCEKNMSIMRCNHPVLNVCLIAHRAFVHPNGQRTKEFYKTCFNDEDCTEKSCKDTDDIVKGRWCEIQCCNTSLCNSGVTPWAKKYMPRTMRQVGGGVGHVTCTSTNQIAIMLLVGLVFVF